MDCGRSAPCEGLSTELTAEQPPGASIGATLNYIIDTGSPAVLYVDWPEMEREVMPPSYAEHVMAVRDGRPFRRTFELDVHGFVFVDHPTQIKDFLDERERTNIYVRELQELVQRHSGASEVLFYDHTVRTSDQHSQRDAGVRQAVKRVHNDYTEMSARKRLRATVGFAAAERRLQRRWAIIQVWRPIGRPVLVAPVGICDGRSVRRQNLVRVERRYRDRTGENYQVSHDPAHQWFYFPQMMRHEALLFKTFDSDHGVPSRFAPHSAFDVPGAPARAPARESIESRAFAFFD